MDQLPKISFLISGYGTNLKVILEKILKDKQKKFFILGIISNNNIDNNIKEKSLKINKKIKIYENVKKLNNLHLKNSNLIFSLGYMKLIPPNIIKNFFKPFFKSFPKDIPLNNIEEKNFKCIAKKIRPSDSEQKDNSRSRSAIMRAFQKI